MKSTVHSLENRAVLVLGMHRSGTSMTAGVLSHLSVAFGPTLLAPNENNPKGYFEHYDIIRLHDELLAGLNSRWDDPRPLPADWIERPQIVPFAERLRQIIQSDFSGHPLWGFKDPKLCRLLPLWLPLLERLGVRTHCLLVVRHPAEVARSLKDREAMDPNYAGTLWLQHLLLAEAATRRHPRLLVDYSRLVGDWPSLVDEVTAWLQLDPTEVQATAMPAVADFVDGQLRHHVVDDFVDFDHRLAAALTKVYRALTARLPAEALSATLDSTRREIDESGLCARLGYGPAIERLQVEIQDHQRRLDTIRRSWTFRAMRPFRAAGRALSGHRI